MISLLSIIPIRSEASESSELVSQLLFGEEVDVIERVDSWTKIKTLHDNYEGWVDTKMLSAGHAPIDCMIVTSATARIQTGNDIHTITRGSKLPVHKGTFSIGDKDYKWLNGECKSPGLPMPDAIKLILEMKNSPYLWGGRTPFGIDCSGLSQLLYRLIGIEIPRDASQQISLGHEVFLTEAKAGDLAFFQKNGKVTHVGILLDNKTIIHASGWVRIDAIDVNGIYKDKTTEYTHDLVSVTRIM